MITTYPHSKCYSYDGWEGWRIFYNPNILVFYFYPKLLGRSNPICVCLN